MAYTTWTVADVALLEAAIKKGARKVQYQDKMVEYRSLNEMYAVLRDMKEKLGLTRKSGRVFAEYDKGHDS